MNNKQPEALRLADALEQGTYLLSVERDASAAELRGLHAKVAELEAQIEAVGAGGVGPLLTHEHVKQPAAAMLTASERAVERDELLQVALNFIETLTGMQPPPIEIAPPEVFAPFRDFVDRIQAVTDRRSSPLPEQQGEPVASIYIAPSGEREFDDWRVDLPAGRNLLYTRPQPATGLNLSCKSEQKRLAAIWGFVPAQQPLTSNQIWAIPECRTVTGGTSRFSDVVCAIRAVERAHGIGSKA